MKLTRDTKEQQGQSYIQKQDRKPDQAASQEGWAGHSSYHKDGPLHSEEEVRQQNCVSLEEIPKYGIPN